MKGTRQNIFYWVNEEGEREKADEQTGGHDATILLIGNSRITFVFAREMYEYNLRIYPMVIHSLLYATITAVGY